MLLPIPCLKFQRHCILPAVGGVPLSAALKAIRRMRSTIGAFWWLFGTRNSHYCPVVCQSALYAVDRDSSTALCRGGITAQSDAEAEWVETQRKAAVLYNLLQGNL